MKLIKSYDLIQTDVLVVGGGAAGALAALEAKKNTDKVVLVSKGSAGRSGNTPMAEGGIQASFHINDSPRNHFIDTMEAGRNINDKSMVEILVNMASDCMKKLEEYGVKFKKSGKGEYFQYTTSGSTGPRCLWIIGGGSGLVQPVVKTAKKYGVEIYDDVMITRLLTSENEICGACGIDLKTGNLTVIDAKAVVLATGGNENLYSLSDASLDSSGDGVALAYNAGAELVDMEFIQFYPHSLVYPESLRGVIIPEEVYYSDLIGGKLTDRYGEPFAYRYDSIRKEGTTRDILARGICTEIAEGRGTEHGGVIIDLRNGSMEKMMDLIPALYNYLHVNGIDMFSEKLEVAPSAHYQCGGIRINERAETTIKGLYAAGECTGGINGANRLSSNALTEAVVYGTIAGKNAALYVGKNGKNRFNREQVDEEYIRINELVNRNNNDGADVIRIKKELQSLMSDKVGVIRSMDGLIKAVEELGEIKDKKLDKIRLRCSNKVYNLEMLEYLELCNLVDNALIVAKAALFRTESRGNHFRIDYPSEDNRKWKRSIRVKKDGNGILIL